MGFIREKIAIKLLHVPKGKMNLKFVSMTVKVVLYSTMDPVVERKDGLGLGLGCLSQSVRSASNHCSGSGSAGISRTLTTIAAVLCSIVLWQAVSVQYHADRARSDTTDLILST